jgi:hypothetical protein
MKPLPPPTAEEREQARLAAAALRAAIADPTTMGERIIAHVDFGRPRRAVWLVTWRALHGFTRTHEPGRPALYSHRFLPGWEYTRAEIVAELIPDLEALAERGERPTVPTRQPEAAR